MDISKQYHMFVKEFHSSNSGIAHSYVRAMEITNSALRRHTTLLKNNETLWTIMDCLRLEMLYEFVKAEQKKEDGGIFREEKTHSYWKRGFCSAAIKSFANFIVYSERQQLMIDRFNQATDAKKFASDWEKLDLPHYQLLLDNDKIKINSAKGKEVIKEVKIRQNQYVFRKIILLNYQSSCCLTGLPIPEILRASHISSWSGDEVNRLNPENGLCLSATYDAAFDRHLISFDDDYRLILAPALKEYCSNEAYQTYFKAMEGKTIRMPIKFKPSLTLLQKHRSKLCR